MIRSNPWGLICQERFYSWGLIQGEGLLNLEILRSVKDNIMHFFNTKYVDLNANRDGIKKEKVGQLFSSNISTHE